VCSPLSSGPRLRMFSRTPSTGISAKAPVPQSVPSTPSRIQIAWRNLLLMQARRTSLSFRWTIRFPSALDYVWLQLMATPQARLLSKMMAPERDAMIQVIAQDLASALGSVGPTGEISSAQECNVLTATR
jgi:hypothetical protein